MAILDIFKKKSNAEDAYFKQRQVEEKGGAAVRSEKYLVSDRLINKDLLLTLFKEMRDHDKSASVIALSNTLDNSAWHAGIMINKGYLPKKIISYLQSITLKEIESAMKVIKGNTPDASGYYQIDEPTAARLNLPLGCMILGIVHHLKPEFGIALVMKTSFNDKEGFAAKVRRMIKN